MSPRANITSPGQLKMFFSRGRVLLLLIAPCTCESTLRQVRVAAALKCGLYHQPGSLGDVKYLLFICMKACELSFVDIGVHRTRLIAIPVLRWAGQQKTFL